MKLREKYTLEETCGACPEAYDVYLDGECVANLRLRHGCFTARVGEQEVYEAYPEGDGIFDFDERDFYIYTALRHIDAVVDNDGLKGILDQDEEEPTDPTEVPWDRFEM